MLLAQVRQAIRHARAERGIRVTTTQHQLLAVRRSPIRERAGVENNKLIGGAVETAKPFKQDNASFCPPPPRR